MHGAGVELTDLISRPDQSLVLVTVIDRSTRSTLMIVVGKSENNSNDNNVQSTRTVSPCSRMSYTSLSAHIILNRPQNVIDREGRQS